MAIEFAERVRRIPVYPAARRYALPDDVALLASNESPDPPLPQVVEAIAARARRRSTATPTRRTRALRAALARPLRRAGRRASRSATARATILLAAGEALLEPGAELVYAWPSFSRLPAPRGRLGRDRRSACRSTPTTARPRRDGAARSPSPRGWSSSATRTTRRRRRSAARRRSPPSSSASRAHVVRDPRRGLLRVQPARRPRRVARPARAPPEPRAAADVLQGLRPVRAARRLRAVRLGGLRPARSTRSASRSSATPPRRPPRVEALRHQDAVAERVERAVVARVELEDGLERAGPRAGRVAGELRLARTCRAGRTSRTAVVRGPRRARRARARAGGRARASRARCASRYGDAARATTGSCTAPAKSQPSCTDSARLQLRRYAGTIPQHRPLSFARLRVRLAISLGVSAGTRRRISTGPQGRAPHDLSSCVNARKDYPSDDRDEADGDRG